MTNENEMYRLLVEWLNSDEIYLHDIVWKQRFDLCVSFLLKQIYDMKEVNRQFFDNYGTFNMLVKKKEYDKYEPIN